MPLIEYTMFGRVNKADKAIERIKAFDPTGYTDEPYYACYSGGKDSDAIRILLQLAGVKHDLVHNHTTLDTPETIYYVRSIPNIQIEYPAKTAWQLIEEKCFPPTRRARYCCEGLKEHGGEDRVCMTGVRWSESAKRRKNRGSAEILGSSVKTNIILNADNDEDRNLFETCMQKRKRIVNPIIDWTDEDVWEFLDYYGCKSNPGYACGEKRIGCIGCPMSGFERMKADFAKYPKYKRIYILTFERMLLHRQEKGLETVWESGEDAFEWWIGNRRKKNLPDPMQFRMDI